ncbi:MAG TPA: type II toxin-antitoxin system HicA family toxin, partial [Candidatus Avimonoglobus intestinipullorum]|nr:type II toxin-antitoxin system HicA family toxin [Candidatus Avimonoglobus intestinipullorum]
YKLLLKDGWELIRVHGSHHILKKGNKIETIPIHNKDVPKGLLNAIIKNTGIQL